MSDFDSLPPLREVLARHGLAAKKNLGQNFLLDLNITLKIARIAGPLAGATVLEIGPGPGGLTRALLAQGANIIAIERDERCLPILAEIQQLYPGRLDIITADALRCDFAALAEKAAFPQRAAAKAAAPAGAGGKIKIIANLPYNIGTELLLQWLQAEPWPPYYQSMTLMFQKEVAERIVARAGDKAYGRLSVLANWRCETAIVMQLPPQAFTPPPKVASAVVQFIPRQQPLPCSAARLAKVTQAAFGQRRKMLRQSLKQLNFAGETAEEFLRRHNIDPTRRAETLRVEEFVRLANGLPNRP